jgi:alpha-galactosidase
MHAQINAQASADEANKWMAAKFLGQASDIDDTTPPFSFTYGGKPSGDFLKTWTVARASTKLDDNRTQQVVTYTDPATGLEVRCVGVQYGDFPAAEWTLHFKNTSAKDTPILENIQAIDTTFPVGDHGANLPVLHYSEGGYCGPNAYQPHEIALGQENTHQSFNPGGRGSDRYLPYFNLENGTGGVMIAMGWPGQWKMEFSDPGNWVRRVNGGMELTHFLLHPGEEVRSPLIALVFWQGGDWIDGQNLWRRWMITHNMPTKDGKPLPSQLAGCSSHLFGEMIHANEENQRLFVDTYTEKGLKLDYWWMDAGWYFNNGRWDNVGTWEVDTKRFPKGLRAITDNAHAKGVKSIVWFEPERVTPGTWLWDNHPEWLLSKNAENRLLDMGNAEAWKWLVEHIDGLLVSQGIDLYRQDFNINPLGYWRENDAPDRQGITEIKYNEGYLAYWDELRRRHPGMLIDSCASGGRRNDLETLRRSVPLLRNDDIGRPRDEQGHVYGLSLWVPYHGSGTAPEMYTFRSVMGWHITMGPDARDPKVDYEPIKKLVAQWRELSPNIVGDFYPLTPYSLSDNAWLAWQYNRPEAGAGMVQVFRRANCAEETIRLRLRGLEPEAAYQVKDIDTSKSQTLTGKDLMGEGLVVPVPERPYAAIVSYQRVGK